MSEFKIESGIQLFSRINESQHNDTLKFTLLPDEVASKEYIEIIGDSGTGKTFLLLDFVVESILPKVYKNVELPGNDVQVILINTDHKFHIGHIANLIEHKLNLFLKGQPLKNIIEQILKKITILKCYESSQLKFTFLNLECILQENEDIKLVAIDSICSYYWMDRQDLGFISFNNYCSEKINTLTKVIEGFNVITVYTKVEIVTHTIGLNSNNKSDYYIRLRRLDDTGNHEIVVFKDEEIISTRKYTLKPFFHTL